jgi:hypothetical protein
MGPGGVEAFGAEVRSLLDESARAGVIGVYEGAAAGEHRGASDLGPTAAYDRHEHDGEAR